MTRVAVVGAGAVGRVYIDAALRSPGVTDVLALVRPSSVARTPRRFRLRPLHEQGGRDGRVVEGYRVVALDAVDEPIDLVVVTTPSTALRVDGFVASIAALPGAPIVLGLQPGLDDRSRWLTAVPEERLVIGTLSLCSWEAPLDRDDAIHDGTVCWFPPMSSFAIAGPTASVVRDILSAGGMPVKVKPGLERSIAIPSAAMVPAIVALELGGWTFGGLRRSGRLGLTARSIRQAIGIAADELGGRVPAWAALVRAPVLWAASVVAGHVAPFDLERFLAVHFVKVGDQTAQQLETWCDAGARHERQHDAIATLADALRTRRHEFGLTADPPSNRSDARST